MKRLFVAIVSLGMVIASVRPTFAQAPAESGPGQYIGLIQSRLLKDPKVQQELNLDDDQRKMTDRLVTEIEEKFAEARSLRLGLPGDQGQARMNEIITPILDDSMKRAKSFLKPDQLNRFHQIDVQAAGPMAFTYPIITRKVGLTQEQAPKVRALILETQAETRKIFQAAAVDRRAATEDAATMEKVRAAQRQTLNKIVAMLNDDRRKAWLDLVGARFEYVENPLPPLTPR